MRTYPIVEARPDLPWDDGAPSIVVQWGKDDKGDPYHVDAAQDLYERLGQALAQVHDPGKAQRHRLQALRAQNHLQER